MSPFETTALNKCRRVTVAQGHTRKFWLAGGAIAMGIGICSMHFIGKQEQARFEQLEIDRGQFEAILSSMTVEVIVIVIITIRDITERMQAEEALREREELLTKAHEELELKVLETIPTPDEAALQIERQPSQV